MLEKLNLRKNVITTVVAFFLNIILTFLGYKLLLNKEGIEVLGLWSILTAAIFIIRIGDVGMGSAAERHVALVNIESSASKLKSYLDTALIINIVLFLFLSIVGYLVFSSNIELIIPKNIEFQKKAQEILLIMFFTFFVSNIANVVLGGLRGLHLGYISAYISIFANFVQLVLFIFLVPIWGIKGLAIGQLIQNLVLISIAWAVVYFQLKKYINISIFKINFSKILFKELFNFSIKAQSINILNGIFEPISKFLIGHTAGMAALGLYELAYKIVCLPRNAVVSGVMGTMPAVTRLFSEDQKMAQHIYIKTKSLVSKVTSAIMFLIMIGSPLASYVLLDNINEQLICYIVILALGFTINSIGSPAYTLGFSTAKMKGNFIASFLSLITLFFISFLGVFFLPNYASVIASGIGLAISGMYVLIHNEKILGLNCHG